LAIPQGILQTRTFAGTSVVIYALDAGGTHPIHGAYEAKPNEWIVCSWTRKGRRNDEIRSSLDIIISEQPPEPIAA